jgi:hypothetical protein
MPLRVRASRVDQPIAGSQASVSVVRIEATLVLAGLACGFVFARPIGVKDASGGAARFRPVLDYAIAARLMAVLGLLALAWRLRAGRSRV